jgi:integrase
MACQLLSSHCPLERIQFAKLTPRGERRPPGISGDDVKCHLGHASIVETSDLYGHLVEGRSSEVAKGLDRAIGGER